MSRLSTAQTRKVLALNKPFGLTKRHMVVAEVGTGAAISECPVSQNAPCRNPARPEIRPFPAEWPSQTATGRADMRNPHDATPPTQGESKGDPARPQGEALQSGMGSSPFPQPKYTEAAGQLVPPQ